MILFNKIDNKPLIEENNKLKQRINELENELNQVANDNGSVIIKQLPEGTIELNGVEVDNNTEVEYYNSSQATYGELTMFRIGKEVKQREMDKLISRHMNEIDKFNDKISDLQQYISNLENQSKVDNDNIKLHEDTEKSLRTQLDKKYHEIDSTIKNYENEKQILIQRYEGMIKGLEEDIQTWKERYLKLNNITLDGTIITKYGEVSGNND